MALFTGIELCAGVGMLGEGVRAAFGFLGHEYRTVCYVEREAAASGQLVTLMEAGVIDSAPVWSDMLTFDGAAWRGKVDCVIAGFPCQDLSIAGRRAGLDGERSGLFFRVCDIADDCDAQYLLLENVSAIASATATVMDEAEGELEERAAARVMGELADRGWNAEWITISASDVGASHRRARWFCFAWRGEAMDNSNGIGTQRAGGSHQGFTSGCGPMGNTRLQYQHSEQRANGAEHPRAGEPMDNTTSSRRNGTWLRSEASIESRQRLLGAGCQDMADTYGARQRTSWECQRSNDHAESSINHVPNAICPRFQERTGGG